MSPLLVVEGLRKTFRSRGRDDVQAVDDVSFELAPGAALGLIGESGSGKSTIARIVLGLVSPEHGRVVFDGTDVVGLPRRRMRALRSHIQMVFQEPFESLNPMMRVGDIVAEPLVIHRSDLSAAERHRKVVATFDEVGLEESLLSRAPRELSGGQQQRVGIARAIITEPKLIVLDEPTASLDVSVRALILKLLERLQEELGLAYLLISHDIATVSYFCDRTAVIYRGRIVETGSTPAVLAGPRHPYTQALLSAALSVDPEEARSPLTLVGDIGDEAGSPCACVLAGRCPIEIDSCASVRPALESVAEGRLVACLRANDGESVVRQTPSLRGE